MNTPPSHEGVGSGSGLAADPRWLRIVSLRRRLWFTFALFLVGPFLISVFTGSDATAMAAAAAIVIAALWTTREIVRTPCPNCGGTYFSREKGGRRIYNNFTSKCMSCGWSSPR